MLIEELIYDYASKGDLPRLELLNYYPKEKVKSLIHHKVNGTTPLLISCLNGHYRVVDFLVRRHSVNIEQIGCITFENETIEGAPPLWAAAAAGHEEIIAYLIGCGAQVNHTTRSNSTPLRAACFDGHFRIVKYLINRGADTEIANHHGHTCLMIACYQNQTNIVELLIKSGVDVNRRSEKGNTALHDCSEAGNLKIIKLLLKHHAFMQMDEFSITPLITAASSGHIIIVDYLVNNCSSISPEDTVKALLLIGATFVDKERDLGSALKYWMFALLKRAHLYSLRNIQCPNYSATPISAYENIKEVQSADELTVMSTNTDWIYMQALIIRERILGPTSTDTTYYIRHRGAVYADAGDFRRCMTLWNHAIRLQLQHRAPLSMVTQTSLLSFAELFSYLRLDPSHWRYSAVPVRDMVDVLALSVYELRRSRVCFPGDNDAGGNGGSLATVAPVPVPAPAPVPAVDSASSKSAPAVGLPCTGTVSCACPLCCLRRQYDQLMLVILHIACLINAFIDDSATAAFAAGGALVGGAELLAYYRATVSRMVTCPVNGLQRKTFLHLACGESSSVIGRYPLCVLPSASMSRALVAADGARLHARDRQGRSALYVAVAAGGRYGDVARDIAGVLRAAGAHVDQPCVRGYTALDLMKPSDRPTECLPLTCLAARQVRRTYPRDYEALGLPAFLRYLVDIH